jgi:DNA modification methylase
MDHGCPQCGNTTFPVECDHAQETPRFNGPKQTTAQVSGHASKAESHARAECPKCGAHRIDSQLGLEHSPEEYVAKMVEVFREVRRVLRDDGTLWLNLGDSYNAYNGNAGPSSGFSAGSAADTQRPHLQSGHGLRTSGLKPKDLVGIPWRVAFALQADGWWLRQDIIWSKPNPMPESVTDRCTKAHEYIFLLAKGERYYYDVEAVKEREVSSGPRVDKEALNAVELGRHDAGVWHGQCGQRGDGHRNRRSVWTVTTQPFPGAHFAVFPEKLITPCILAGCPKGGTVLDPFGGSGTTGVVAAKHGRKSILIDLNPEYCDMARKRIDAAARQGRLL